jgi:integrase
MQLSPDTVSVSQWVNDSSIKEASRRNRQFVLGLFERSNHSSIQEIMDRIKRDEITIYAACKTFVDDMRKRRAPYTVYVYRSMLPGLFQSTLGESNFSRTVFDRLVPCSTPYVSRVKLIPTRDDLNRILQIAGPEYRALIGILACSGMRIGEVLSRKMSDLEIRPEGYARVKLQASETKARYKRFTFLTKECVDWVTLYRSTIRTNEYVFPGETRGHLQYATVQHSVKNLFRQAGLNDASDKSEVYTIHSFRTFASDEMRTCGLREKDALAIIGHKYGAESFYLNWNRVENNWIEACAAKMCFLDTGADAQTHIVELTRQNGKLEALLEKLLEKLTS